MKKYIKLLVPTILTIILILPFNNVQAKTLGELKKYSKKRHVNFSLCVFFNV